MNHNGVVLAVCATMSLLVSSQADAAIWQLCAEDSLSPEQARGRVAWYAKNYPSEILQTASDEWGRSVTLEQALAWYNRLMLEDPVLGGPSKRVRYPTFTTKDMKNPTPKYFAPTDQNGRANKPTNYYWTVTCTQS